MTATQSKRSGTIPLPRRKAQPQASEAATSAPQPLITAQDPDALLKPKDAGRLVGLCVSSLYKKANKGLFPQPIKLGTRCTRWRSGDVRDWIRAQAQAQGVQQ